jgi:hypothetical protein
MRMSYWKPPFGFFLLGLILLPASSASVAHADGAEPAPGPAAEPQPDKPAPDSDDRRYAIDRTWVYGDDARIPLPLTAIATTSASYANVGNSPTRISYPQANVTSCVTAQGVPQPCYSSFAGNTAQPGVSMLVGGELGLLPRLSVQGNVMAGLGGGTDVPNPSVGGTASLRFSVFPDARQDLQLVLSGGYVREAWGGPVYDDDVGKWLPGNPNGDNGMFLQAAIRADIARLRLGGTLHGEHIFADGRDPLDVMVDVGASYLLVGTLRGGVEYVGQDLEETFSPGAEGGARHFLGPIASAQFFDDRLTLVAGPSVGLSRISPDFVARAGASLGF